MDAILHVEDLHKQFHVHLRQARIQAVAGLSFTVAPGTITALTGPSGAGKSTVLNCIHRTYLPSGGHIRLRLDGVVDCDLATCSDHEVLAVRAAHLGFVTQFLRCLPRKSALDVVAAPLFRACQDHDAARQRAADLLAALDIPERLWHLPPATFSGGEKQRINIARGFARRNRVLLLDEPTASLDGSTAEKVIALIQDARDQGTAIIGIWHDPAMVARLADQQVRIHRPATVSSEVPSCPSA